MYFSSGPPPKRNYLLRADHISDFTSIWFLLGKRKSPGIYSLIGISRSRLHQWGWCLASGTIFRPITDPILPGWVASERFRAICTANPAEPSGFAPLPPASLGWACVAASTAEMNEAPAAPRMRTTRWTYARSLLPYPKKSRPRSSLEVVFLAYLAVISRLPVPKKVDWPACNAIGDWRAGPANRAARLISGSGCSHLYLVSEAFPRSERLSNVSEPQRPDSVLSLRPSGFEGLWSGFFLLVHCDCALQFRSLH